MVQEKEHESDGIKILLVGDSKVGKTSLINTLISQEFNHDPPTRLIGVSISAKVNPEHVPLYIEDFSLREQSYDDLRDAIREANAICLVFASSEINSVARVFDHWIPTIRRLQRDEAVTSYKPIILVNNKIDIEPLANETRIADKIRDSVDGFIQVSALTQENVFELFYLAQKSVIYPKGPLFDSQLRMMSKKCRSALIEIFKLCDVDNDGLLNDHELNLFQENCFGTPLQKDALVDLKSIIEQSTNNGISNNGITQDGFLFLHTLWIDNGQPHFTWQVLRNFKYDSNIDIRKDTDDSEDVNGLTKDFLTKTSLIDLSDSFAETSRKERGRLTSFYQEEEEELYSNDDISEDARDHGDNRLRCSQIDLYNYYKENSKVIKAGFGFTLVTVASMLALKYLVQGGKGP